jgi:hypothetical protein
MSTYRAAVLASSVALRADFASDDLFGATIEMIQWVFERPAFEPAVVFEVVWHQCADKGGRLPMRRAANDA